MSMTARVRRRKQDPAFDYNDDIDDDAKNKRHNFQRTPELQVPPRPPPDLLTLQSSGSRVGAGTVASSTM